MNAPQGESERRRSSGDASSLRERPAREGYRVGTRLAVAILWLFSLFSAFAQGPELLREAFSREYSIHIGGEQTPLVKDIASREVSIFVGAESAPPYREVISRELSVLITTPDVPAR